MKAIRIATRRSPLAIWQAQHVARSLRASHGNIQIDLVPMRTRGDKITHTPLTQIGGKALFVKELETALLENKADIAAHSMKDVPAELPRGLHLPAAMARDNPYDALVSMRFSSFMELPPGARVGTCSLRRKCQLRARRPDLSFHDLRGNVDTRLRRLEEDSFEAVILAYAGLNRLGKTQWIREVFSCDTLIPAIGQGVIGIECRQDDTAIEELIAPLNDPDTAACVASERAMNRILGGSCQVPIAGFATLHGEQMRLRGMVGRADGNALLLEESEAPRTQPEQLGNTVASALLARGAAELISRG